MKAAKPKKPTHYQSAILARIAHSPMMKTLGEDRLVRFSLQSGERIPTPTALALICNGWVKPNRDGLGLFDESQTYTALKP